MAQKKFSELEAGAVDGTSIFAQTKTEDGSLVSKSASSPSLAGYIGTSYQFAGLSTTAKNLVGAINEAASMGGVVQLTQAEYTALLPAEKMNGSIYKLTDKAVMMCLDEEYHAVKELLTTEYEALSSAEQNNGTIYIRTDAETTGSDIAVSDSDNTSIAEALSKFGFDNIKSQTFTGLTVPANNIDTRDLTLTVPADYGILCGFSLAGTSNCSIIQCYFNSKNVLHTRVLNLANQQDSYTFVVFYI